MWNYNLQLRLVSNSPYEGKVHLTQTFAWGAVSPAKASSGNTHWSGFAVIQLVPTHLDHTASLFFMSAFYHFYLGPQKHFIPPI